MNERVSEWVSVSEFYHVSEQSKFSYNMQDNGVGGRTYLKGLQFVCCYWFHGVLERGFMQNG